MSAFKPSTSSYSSYSAYRSVSPAARDLPPRTPNESYYQAGKSPKNKYEFGLFSKRYLPPGNAGNISRSRIDQNLSANQSPENKFTEETLYLLAEEENNIRYFKQKMDAEKVRIQRDFQNLKREVEHLIHDLQLSFLNEVDTVYTEFMKGYKIFKQSVMGLRQARKALVLQNSTMQGRPLPLSMHSPYSAKASSNREILMEIERDAQLLKVQQMESQIYDCQRDKMANIKIITDKIIKMGAIDTQYYQEGETANMIRRVVDSFRSELRGVYGDIKNYYVIAGEVDFGDPDKKALNGSILNALHEDDQKNSKASIKNAIQKSQKDMEPPSNQYYNLQSNFTYAQDFRQEGRQNNLKGSRSASQESRTREQLAVSTPKKHMFLSPKEIPTSESPPRRQGRKAIRISLDQQNLASPAIEQVAFRESSVINGVQHTQAILCGVFANDGKQFVTGCKDKMVRVYDLLTGKMLYSLPGHQAGICSISSHGNFISTGGDYGCSSLILWDTKSWTILSRVQAHTAAVTCIVDMSDGETLASGSYDQRINIYNYRKGSMQFTMSQNKSKIACMIISADKKRIIASGLDQSITVWKIFRENNIVSNLKQERTIANPSLICTLRPFALRPNLFLAGTRDGKIQIIDLNNGETMKKLTVGSSSVIELVLFERENQPDFPIVVSCSPKEKTLMLTRTDTGVNTFVDVKGMLNIDYGCGIGPKIVLSEMGQMGIVSQSPLSKNVLIYNVNLQ